MRIHTVVYSPAMFATCVPFMVFYGVCVVLSMFFPDMPSHATLQTAFPGLKFMNVPNFVYGMDTSAIYGWTVVAVFVFFCNLWSWLAHALFGVQA